MDRSYRQPIAEPTPNTSRRQVRNWMRRNAEDFENATELAEAANTELELPFDAMEDGGHWLWEEAMSAIEQKGGQHD